MTTLKMLGMQILQGRTKNLKKQTPLLQVDNYAIKFVVTHIFYLLLETKAEHNNVEKRSAEEDEESGSDEESDSESEEDSEDDEEGRGQSDAAKKREKTLQRIQVYFDDNKRFYLFYSFSIGRNDSKQQKKRNH